MLSLFEDKADDFTGPLFRGRPSKFGEIWRPEKMEEVLQLLAQSGSVDVIQDKRHDQTCIDVPLWHECQPIGGHGRAGDIPAQTFELAPLEGLGGDAGMQREAGGLGQLAIYLLSGRARFAT